MPPDPNSSPTTTLISRELYEQIIHYSIVPVTLLLIGMGWYILIYFFFSPKRRQERRSREIRRAVAARQAFRETENTEITLPKAAPEISLKNENKS